MYYYPIYLFTQAMMENATTNKARLRGKAAAASVTGVVEGGAGAKPVGVGAEGG